MSAATQTADRIEIAELFARLANLLDEGRHDNAHSVYHDDVVVRSPRGGELHGLDEVTAYLKRSQVEGEHTQHVHGDVLVHVDGDRAKATANELVYFYRNGAPPHRTSGLRSACTAVRTPRGLAIQRNTHHACLDAREVTRPVRPRPQPRPRGRPMRPRLRDDGPTERL